MTTPQQPPPQQPGTAADAAAAAAIGTALATAVTATAALGTLAGLGVLAGLLKAQRVSRQALLSSLDITISYPPGETGFYGPATMQMERINRQRRAMFVLAAARRIQGDLTEARSRGTSQAAALAGAVQRERRFYAQHLIATWQRSQAGAQVDSQAMAQGGLLLGWHTVKDSRTSADCLAANGKNFYADHMPLIGYPGAVHPHCRCQAGIAFPGARLLPSYGIPTNSRYRKAA